MSQQYLPTFEPLESENSPELTSSLAGSPVRTLAPPTRTQAASMARALVYGMSSPVLLASYDPERSYWKTCQQSLFMDEAHMRYSGNLPSWGITHNGELFQLAPPGRLTKENAGSQSGLTWSTPCAMDGIIGDVLPAETEVYMLKTGRLRKRLRTGHDSSLKLSEEMARYPIADNTNKYPTPQARDWKTQSGPNYNHVALPRFLGGNYPNPAWIEKLMGLPEGWTEL